MNYETTRNQWIIIILYVTAISDNYNVVSFPKIHKSENRIIVIYIFNMGVNVLRIADDKSQIINDRY